MGEEWETVVGEEWETVVGEEWETIVGDCSGSSARRKASDASLRL